MPATHRLKPQQPVVLAELPTRAGKGFHSGRSAAGDEFRKLHRELIELQARLYAEARQRLLIVLQAMDAGGKDGTIRRVFSGVNPQGVRVHSFKKPTPEELAHDYLWRVHNAAPAAGMIGIYNRSHYEDVLVVRVENLAPEDVWRKRYRQINDFERMLSENSTTILKFFLYISAEEQHERFLKRLHDPAKQWKFSSEDLEKRQHWDRYMAAYEDALNQCTTDWAPWYVIPADQKWYRNLAIARVIVDTLKELNPQFPAASIDLQSAEKHVF